MLLEPSLMAMMQKKKLKEVEQEAGAVAAKQNGQQQAKQKSKWSGDEEAVGVKPKKKLKAKPAGSLGGHRTTDMMRLLVS
jgi:hypothetical protein